MTKERIFTTIDWWLSSIRSRTRLQYFFKHPIFCVNSTCRIYILILSQSAHTDTRKKNLFDNIRHSQEKKLYQERKARNDFKSSRHFYLLAHLLSNLPCFNKCSNDFKFTSRSTRIINIIFSLSVLWCWFLLLLALFNPHAAAWKKNVLENKII